MLSIAKSQLSEVLGEFSDIPTDITFHVEDEVEKVHVFHAHKYYLALVSKVLRTRFFGSLRETSDIFVVKGTTSQALETMINHVYHKNCSWEKKTVEELFEVANIAEMYDVAGLMKEVTEVVGNIQITLTNVVDLAHTAEQFSFLSEVSECLLRSCVSFLQKTLLTHVLDFSGLVHSPDQMETVKNLHDRILEIPLPCCPRCDVFMWNTNGLHFCPYDDDEEDEFEDLIRPRGDFLGIDSDGDAYYNDGGEIIVI